VGRVKAEVGNYGNGKLPAEAIVVAGHKSPSVGLKGRVRKGKVMVKER